MHCAFNWGKAYWRSALLLALLLLIGLVSAANEVILIKSPGCLKCAAAEGVLNEVIADNSSLKLVSYDYFSDEGHRIIKEHNVKGDIPSIVIGKQVIGYNEYKGDNAKLDSLVREALANQSGNQRILPNFVQNTSSNQNNNQSINNSLLGFGNGAEINLQKLSLYSVFAVLIAGLLAGFNPCLLGILVFLAASVLSSSGRKRELLTMVVFFSLGIFAVYFLFGLGMQRLLQAEVVAQSFRYVLTLFLIILGLAQMLDAIKLGRGGESLFRTDWALKYFQAGLSQKRLSSYFLIGALFSLVKAPCVGAVYLAILDLISAKSYAEGSIYLFFYNLGIIMPIVLLGGFIALGMSPDEVDAIRKNYRVSIRLITGIALLMLAPLIYWQII